MDTPTHIAETLDTAGSRAKYDANAKEVLADKAIISEIVKRLIPEFRDIPVSRIPEYIAEPSVASVGVHPGQTNAIRSLGQEYTVESEGKTTFDVFFPLRLPDTDQEAAVYVNLEAQNKERLPYALESRAVYYAARLLSSQYQRDFAHSEYEKLKKVYSIWIITEPDAASENSIASIQFNQTCVAGQAVDNGKYDLEQIFMVRLGSDYTDRRIDRLVRMLSALFSSTMDAKAKKNILGEQFGIPMSEKLEQEVDSMCNLSQGIYDAGVEKGERIGIENGEKLGIEKGEGLAAQKIAKSMGISIDKIREALAQ